MSASDTSDAEAQSRSNSDDDDDRYVREPARRATYAEIRNAKADFTLDEVEDATKYQVLPTMEDASRVLIAGTVLNVIDHNADDDDSDPYYQVKLSSVGDSGTISAFAGQYADDSVLESISALSAPTHVMMSAKLRLIDGDADNIEDRTVKLRPEWVTEVSEEKRDEVIAENAMATIERAENGGTASEEIESFGKDKYEGVEAVMNTDFKADAVETLKSLDK